MKFSRSVIFNRSRDRQFLLRSALAIAGASVILGFLISLFTTERGFDELLPELKEFTKELEPTDQPEVHTRDIYGWAALIRFVAEYSADGDIENIDHFLHDLDFSFGKMSEDPENTGTEKVTNPLESLEEQLKEATLDESEREMLLALSRGLLGDDSKATEATADLRTFSEKSPPPRLASEFLGDVLSHSRDWQGAIQAYGNEFERFPEEAVRALHRQVSLMRMEEMTDELEALLERPEVREHIPIFDLIDLAVDRRDYLGLAGLVIRRDLTFDDPWLVILSLFAATVWFIITTQFSGEWKRKGLWYLAAFVLGYFSATATIYAVILQERLLNFELRMDDTILNQIIYCVAGIGLREELLKLLLFVPLAPFLVKRGNEIDALVCAGLVGLGFAFNENTGYVARGGEFTTWGRFLTANFLHIALTGVAGLALVRAWRWPKRQWDNFLMDFLIVVAAHGAYDALILVPAIGEYGVLSIVVFALIAYLFLDHATQLMRPQGSMLVSPLAVFVIGSALLMGVVLCFACWAVPFGYAMAQYVGGLGGMIPLAFIYINRLRAL